MTETNPVRPFDWRDLTLLHHVREQGLCFDAQLAYTRGLLGLQRALLNWLTPGKATRLLVSRPDLPDGDPGIGQISLEDGDLHARMTFISPAEIIDQPSGMRLLDALAEAAGERGAHSLIAEVDESGPAFVSLRRAGFAIYARQRVWSLSHPAGDPEAYAPGDVWREQREDDTPAIRYLYFDLVPALVQQVEDTSRGGDRGMVHWGQGELLAYLDIERGPLGIWILPFFHPAAEKPHALLRSFLARLPGDSPPAYVCVRSYQSWLNAPLGSLGFEPVSDQAVMVKRLAAFARRPALATLPNLEGTRAEPTAPIANATQFPPPPGADPRS